MAMTDEERYGTIAPTPRNPYVGAAADAAGGLRQFLDKAQVPEAVPLIGGQGVGELLVGQAPEEIDRWSYGMSPFVDKNVPGYSGLRGVPEIQTKRTGPLADTLFLGADATGVGMGVRALGNAGGRQAVRSFNNAISDTGRDASRRKFIKDAGTVGAATAVASATPDIVKAGLRAMKPSATTAATRVVKNSVGSVPEFYKKLRALNATYRDLHRKYADELTNSPESVKIINEQEAAIKARLAKGLGSEHEPDWDAFDMDERLQGHYFDMERQGAKRAQLEHETALGNFISQNPDYADLPTPEQLRVMKREEFTPELIERLGMEIDNDKIEALVRQGGEYIDPTTGNRATVDDYGNFAWQSPDGSIRAYQHWLPEYVTDEHIGRFAETGMRRLVTDTAEIPF